MDIVHCLDDRYVPMCATAIVSLCENNIDLPVHYHIISSSLSSGSRKDLAEIIEKYGKAVTFYDVDGSILKDCSVRDGDHVSVAAYLRILIPRVLPQSVKTALYLDCDLIVCGNIDSLFSISMDGYALGGVYDPCVEHMATYNRLKYSPEHRYFNTGVLLFNMDYWRENDIAGKMFEFIRKYPERLLYWDQDAINSVLVGKIKRLPFKYNMTDALYQRNPNLRQEYLDEIIPCLANPTILHFATSDKPWLRKDAAHPLKDRFYNYLSKTKWTGMFPVEKLSLKYSIKKIIEMSGFTIGRIPMGNYLSINELTGGGIR